MVKKPSIKKQKPLAPAVGKPQQKVVFSFSELRQFSFVDAHNDSKFFIEFLGRLKKLCNVDWSTINSSGRHSFGLEKMEVKYLCESAQQQTPSGMTSLLVFRATGDNHVFLGYRDGNVFQVIFIEYRFGDVYNHN